MSDYGERPARTGLKLSYPFPASVAPDPEEIIVPPGFTIDPATGAATPIGDPPERDTIDAWTLALDSPFLPIRP